MSLSSLLSWSPSHLKDCCVCKANVAVPALRVALCFPALNSNWCFKSNFVTSSVRKLRHYRHRPWRWLPSHWESLGFCVPAACEGRAEERLSWHVSVVLPAIGSDIATHWGSAGTISSLTSPARSCFWQPALSLFLYMITVLLISKKLCGSSSSVASCSNKLLFNIPDHHWGFGWSTIYPKIHICSTFVCCTIFIYPSSVGFTKDCLFL